MAVLLGIAVGYLTVGVGVALWLPWFLREQLQRARELDIDRHVTADELAAVERVSTSAWSAFSVGMVWPVVIVGFALIHVRAGRQR